MWKKFLAVTAIFFLLVACSHQKEVVEEESDETQDVTEEPEPVPEEEPEFPFYFPLTGIGSEEDTGGRSIAVMINNHPNARPQSGLYKADIVYELIAEGGITRFLAIFQSEKPEIVGPVRSAREYYIKLAKGYDSYYIAHGYSADAEEMLRNGFIDHINGMQYDGTLFQRASFRKAPHNSYITYENILKGAEKLQYDLTRMPKALPFLNEEEIAQLSGEAATDVTVDYLSSADFSANYVYDATSVKYKRFSNQEQTVDYETGEPVLLDNIFIVETAHSIIVETDRTSIDLTSGGRGILLQKGKWNEMEWRNVDGRILPYKNGTPVSFVPGKTWISVIPANPGIEEIVTIQ
ncbi:DUF3048 domain-containing protein [Bacillaceae bacterium Marseille-Q3522]|nr:DUF3048 domain-containing protein [Bacillaceae bacterium Marseille-Q3522]